MCVALNSKYGAVYKTLCLYFLYKNAYVTVYIQHFS